MRLKEALDKEVKTMVDILKSDCDGFLKEIKGGTTLDKKNFTKGGWIQIYLE